MPSVSRNPGEITENTACGAVTLGSTGQRSFATDSRATIFVNNTGAPIANPIPAGTTFLQ